MPAFVYVAFFGFAVAAGYGAGARSWNGVVYLTDGTLANNNLRNPAAIKRELDFSRLYGAELITASQKRLVTAARLVLAEGSIGVELGHFVTRDESGQRQLACDGRFNRLTMRFEAEGVASAGEKPSMTVDAPCRMSDKDITSIAAVWIPVKRFLDSPAMNVEIDVTDSSTFKFEDMNGAWPMSWSLQSVRLYSVGEPEREVKISAPELRGLRKQPFVMNWLEARRAEN